MQPVSAVAIYFIIWWMVLFAVLPWGAGSAHEKNQEVEPGTMRSAPLRPRIALKFAVTTIIAAVIFAGVYWLITTEAFSIDDIPFFPKFRAI